jgi:type II secretory pathway pseudopilin PulG
MEPNRRHLHLSEEGFGLLGTMITVGVVVTMVGLLLTYLSDAFVYEAKMRVNSLEKKSFGGAEQTLINQRQCRCNFLKQSTTGGGNVIFSATPSTTATISLNQLKTYYFEDTCADVNATTTIGGAAIPADDILSDTTKTFTQLNQSRSIVLTNITVIIPQYLYRGELNIAPVWAAPISFPILMVTEPAAGGLVKVDICGVDRAS